MPIDPFHRLYLEEHAVDPELAEKLGVRSITDPTDLPAPFEYLNGQGTPALLYPWSDGTREWHQLHPDKVPVVDGEERKYVFPFRETPLLWLVHDPARPAGELWVEGTKQALAAASTGIGWRVRAIAGCWSWYSDGAPIPGVYGAADGLDLVVLLDADVDTNSAVWDAGARMLSELGAVAGAASVKIGRVPGGGKSGLDDVLAKAPVGERLPMLERIVKGASAKLGTRPRDPDPRVASGLFTMRPNRSIALLVQNVARELDRIAPWAWQEKGDSLWRYNATTGVYEHVPPRAFEAHLAHLLGNDYEARYARDALGGVKHNAAMNRRILDPTAAPSRKVAVANGVLDPKTGVLEEHSPDHLLLGAWATHYDETAECPRILAYLEEQFPGQVDVILDTAARMLNRVDPQDRTLFLFGPPRSGKSTVVRLLEAVTGDDACSHVSLHQLASRPFAAAQLFGKSLNTFADLSSAEVQDTSIFKALTGGDAIDAERKHEQFFQFTNRALLVFSANEVPALPADSEAEFARFVPVKAGRSFLGKEDPAVEAALMEELPGLLAELVRRYRVGRMPAPSPEVRQEFRLAGDKVARYVAQRLDVWPADAPWKGAPRGSTVHDDFQKWCVGEGVKALSASRFYAGLTKNGVTTGLFEGVQHVKADIRGGKGSAATPFGGLGGLPDDLRACAREEVGVDERTREEVAQKSTNPTGPVAVDFETPSAEAMGSGAHEGPFCRLLAYTDADGAHTTADPDRMRGILANASRLITHNGWAFDLPAAGLELGLDVEELIGKSEDTQVRARLAWPPRAVKGADRDKYHLADLAPAVLGEDRRKGDMLPVLKRRHGGYDRIPTDDPDYNAYARLDAELTRDLWTALPDPDAYYEREREVAKIAGRLTVTGLRVDVPELNRRMDDRDAVARAAFEHLEAMGLPAASSLAARPWTTAAAIPVLDSLAQEAWGIDWPRTKKGAVRSDRELLQAIVEEAEGPVAQLAGHILAITAGGSPFLPAVRKHLRATGRIHPQHKLASATGRWSTSSPNTLGSGKRSAQLLSDREVILAEPGQVFVAVDLAGIDQRAVWGLSGDEAYGQLFAPGVDIHDEMCKLYFGELTKPLRAAAKPITHGIPYGRGAGAITNVLIGSPGRYFGWTYEDAYPEVRAAWDRYFQQYAGVKEWQAEVRRRGEDGETMDNGFGRGIRVAPAEAYTEAPARLAQSAARDLAMEGLLRIKAAGLAPMLREFIHDEVLLSVPEAEAQRVGEQVAELMSFDWHSPSGVVVPIVGVFDGKAGPTWADCYTEE